MGKLEAVYRRKLLAKKGRINLSGMTFEHWSDRDTAEDGTKDCRVWHRLGGLTIPAGRTSIDLAMSKPWVWRVTLMARLPGGTIEQVELDIKSRFRIQDLDGVIAGYRAELLLSFPAFEADGWRAVIVD